MDLPPGMEVRFVADTADTVHVAMPVDPNTPLSEKSWRWQRPAKGGSTIDSYGRQYQLRWNPERKMYEHDYNV